MFVNGLPLGLIELKVPGQESATLRGAWNQLRTYAAQIPSLLAFNAVSVVSTGTQARLGALGGKFEHYAPWKTIDGETLAPAGVAVHSAGPLPLRAPVLHRPRPGR